MKRLLVVSSRRDFMAELASTLLDLTPAEGLTPIDEPAPPEWEVARAVSGLEAFLLLDRGGRPFDALMVDAPLADQSALAFMNRVRRSQAGRDIPVFLLADPGQEQHVRQMIAETFATTRFIDKPVTVQTLAGMLGDLTAHLQIVLAEYDDELRERYELAFTRAGYRVQALARGRDAIERQPRLRANAVVTNVVLPDVSGLEVCSHVRKAAVVPKAKVVLYGRLAALNVQRRDHIDEPDDFVGAPFDEDLLVDRVASLIGRTDHRRSRRSSRLPPTEDLPEGKSALPRPPSRRIPCRLDVRMDDDRCFAASRFDLSPQGLFVPADEMVSIGAGVELTIDFGDRDGPIRTGGEVAWVSYLGTKRGFGVRFLSLDPSAVERLKSHVAQAGDLGYDP